MFSQYKSAFQNQPQQQQQPQFLFNNSIDSNSGSSVNSLSLLTAANTIVFSNSVNSNSSSPASSTSFHNQSSHQQAHLVSPLALSESNNSRSSLFKLKNLQIDSQQNSPDHQAGESSASKLNALFKAGSSLNRHELDFDLHFTNAISKPSNGIPFLANNNNSNDISSKKLASKSSSSVGHVLFKDDEDVDEEDTDDIFEDDDEDDESVGDDSNDNSVASLPPARMNFMTTPASNANNKSQTSSSINATAHSVNVPIENNKFIDINNNNDAKNMNKILSDPSKSSLSNRSEANAVENQSEANKKVNFSLSQNSQNSLESFSPASNFIG